jgi:hypothetical protein
MPPPHTTKQHNRRNTVKKQTDHKKLVLDRQTIRLLEAQQLRDVAGGRKNPTRGLCAATCASEVFCPF